MFQPIALALLVATLYGCTVMLVEPYDKEAVTRITELSKSSLAELQALLDTKEDERGAAFRGKLAKSWADVETQARVHLVFEKSRTKNRDSADIAQNFLDAWSRAKTQFCLAPIKVAAEPPAAQPPATKASAVKPIAAQAPASAPGDSSNVCSGSMDLDPTALSDDSLVGFRKVTERILGSMVTAEEAKKLGDSASK